MKNLKTFWNAICKLNQINKVKVAYVNMDDLTLYRDELFLFELPQPGLTFYYAGSMYIVKRINEMRSTSDFYPKYNEYEIYVQPFTDSTSVPEVLNKKILALYADRKSGTQYFSEYIYRSEVPEIGRMEKTEHLHYEISSITYDRFKNHFVIFIDVFEFIEEEE